MHNSKKNFKKRIAENGCESCGYKDYFEVLTLHHMYPKRKGHQIIQVQGKSRRERYLLVCLNCHELIERGLIDGKKLLKEILATQTHGKTEKSQ